MENDLLPFTLIIVSFSFCIICCKWNS
jgi:hypothetical protein